MSDGPITMKCPKCGLDNPRKPICGESGEGIEIFPDFYSSQIVDKAIERVEIYCPETDTTFYADVEPDHNLDYLRGACQTYAEQIGLESRLIGWEVLMIRGRWTDAISYDDTYIGTTFSQCVENLDKAAAGEDFGRPLSDWEED